MPKYRVLTVLASWKVMFWISALNCYYENVTAQTGCYEDLMDFSVVFN